MTEFLSTWFRLKFVLKCANINRIVFEEPLSRGSTAAEDDDHCAVDAGAEKIEGLIGSVKFWCSRLDFTPSSPASR